MSIKTSYRFLRALFSVKYNSLLTIWLILSNQNLNYVLKELILKVAKADIETM